MNIDGIVIGCVAFVLIGLFHPIIIVCEYHFSSRCWPVFLALGALFLALSAECDIPLCSAALGILGMTCLWSIVELKEQKKRVEKGWFPRKPKAIETKIIEKQVQ